MKHLKVAVLALLFITGFSVNAQDENNPWAIGLGINAVDFYPTNASEIRTKAGNATGWYDEFHNANDHYNIIPAISRLTVSRYLASGFSFEAGATLNKIEKIGDYDGGDLTYFGLDGALKYDLNKIIGETAWFDPYALIGGGYTWLDDGGHWGTTTGNAGLGANIWLSDNIGLNIESKYKHEFETDNMIQHFQHAAGIVVKFGGSDRDGDGIVDKKDECPDTFGLKEFNGCPDSDNDGIIDSKDDCPNTAGLAELNGCPDRDGDGIADKNDACPDVAGPKETQGCPDTDGDGIVDKDDECPKVAGPKENKGCPWGDTDGDGVLDNVDKCVNEAGPASNDGCPEMSQDTVDEMQGLIDTVYFDYDSDVIKSESKSKLDAVAEMMKKYTGNNFTILAGHTDSKGSNSYNMDLSNRRANSVKNYLVGKGVSSEMLNSKGFGEEQPVATNDTAEGRALNRRVEIKLNK